jgi:hypothetical protein
MLDTLEIRERYFTRVSITPNLQRANLLEWQCRISEMSVQVDSESNGRHDVEVFESSEVDRDDASGLSNGHAGSEVEPGKCRHFVYHDNFHESETWQVDRLKLRQIIQSDGPVHSRKIISGDLSDMVDVICHQVALDDMNSIEFDPAGSLTVNSDSSDSIAAGEQVCVALRGNYILCR